MLTLEMRKSLKSITQVSTSRNQKNKHKINPKQVQGRKNKDKTEINKVEKENNKEYQ